MLNKVYGVAVYTKLYAVFRELDEAKKYAKSKKGARLTEFPLHDGEAVRLVFDYTSPTEESGDG